MIELTDKEAVCFFTLLANEVTEVENFQKLAKEAGYESKQMELDKEFYWSIIEKLQPVVNIKL